MRWLWLSIALSLGCGQPPAENQVGRSATAGDGWAIRGTSPERLLLTNGTTGVWLKTDQGISNESAYRLMGGDVLLSIPALTFNSDNPKGTEERLDWSFDLRTGEFTTKRSGGTVDFELKVVLHPSQPVVATRWVAKGGESSGRVLGIECGLPLIERNGPDQAIYELRSAISGEAQDVRLHLTSSAEDGIAGLFLNGESTELPKSYDEVLAASKRAHDEFWKTDIEIDGPAEDQLAIRVMLYYLRRGATPKLPPFGASNAKYRGARFWDAEAWMLPVLAVVDREAAEKSTRWRLENLGDHIAWEAAVGGKDVTPKEFGNALHVAGWVAWWTSRAVDLQLASPDDEKRVLEVAFPQFCKAASDSERGMEIKGVESPDEGKLRNNDLVTNLLAKRVARAAADHGIADGEDLEWFSSIVIPRAADGLPATYDNDLIRGYQQTAALLAIYPLQEDFGEGVAEKMFERYADLTSEVGPAMSESVHATIAARLGREEAYGRWRKSWETYTDGAMMFHERRNRQDAYFMTAAAGCLQTVLFGFAGMALTDEGKESATGKLLPDGYPVAFRPSLPAEWKRITLHNIFIGPRRLTVRIDQSGASIE